MLIPLPGYDNVFYTFDYDDVTQVTFSYEKGRYSDKIHNIMTMDTEHSSAYLKNGKAIPFKRTKYRHKKWFREMIKNLPTCACMYLWQFSIDDFKNDRMICFLGRTYRDFDDFTVALSYETRKQMIFGPGVPDSEYVTENVLTSKHQCSCYVYIHNLAFDFVALSNIFDEQLGASKTVKKKIYDEFGECELNLDGEIRTHPHTFAHTFARNSRRPMKTYIAVNNLRIEIKDSYVLTQKSLSEWGKDENLPVCKLKVKESFYYKIRTPLTPLEELIKDGCLEYSIIDTITMIYGLRNYVKRFGKLWKIPLTATSIIRKRTRNALQVNNPEWQETQLECQNSYDYHFYRDVLRQLYTGGWTHANARYVKRVLLATKENPIYCFDFASSYPYQMCCCDHLPVSAFHEYDVKHFDDIKDNPLSGSKIVWFGKFKFKNIRSKLWNTFFSVSKCLSINGQTKKSDKLLSEMFDNSILKIDNGRIAAAEEIECYLSDYEYDIFTKAYKWDEMEVSELYVAQAGRLPDGFIKMLLDLYNDKTKLKFANPSQYRAAKSDINGAYGMINTAILSAVISYKNGKWFSDESEETMIELYSQLIDNTKAENMIAQYPVGIYICKAAMYALWQFIIKFDERVIYCDTDSLKGYLTKTDLKEIEKYNKRVLARHKAVAAELGISPDLFAPFDKDKNGNDGARHPLGVFDREHDVNIEMAVLGAKRYFCKFYDTDKKGREFVNHTCTVAGLPKAAGAKKYQSAAEFIDPDNSFVDVWESGKKICYYNPDQPNVEWTDNLGIKYISTERHTCAILPTSYDISISSLFEKFLKALDTGYIEDVDDETPECLIFN